MSARRYVRSARNCVFPPPRRFPEFFKISRISVSPRRRGKKPDILLAIEGNRIRREIRAYITNGPASEIFEVETRGGTRVKRESVLR